MKNKPQVAQEPNSNPTRIDELAYEIEAAKAVENSAKRLSNYKRSHNCIMFVYLLGGFCTLFNLAPPPQFMAVGYDSWIEGVPL